MGTIEERKLFAVEETRSLVANESERTKKAREKIERQKEAIAGRISPESLQKKSCEILSRIVKNAHVREALSALPLIFARKSEIE